MKTKLAKLIVAGMLALIVSAVNAPFSRAAVKAAESGTAISGATTAVVGSEVLLTFNSSETVVWGTLTPEIVSINEYGLVEVLAVGYGIIQASSGSVTAVHTLRCIPDFKDGGIWNSFTDFPYQQGENNFSILFGPSGNGGNPDLTQLNTYECVRSLDTSPGKAQWKGGTYYATLSQTFIMPGEGTIAMSFSAPAEGNYEVLLQYEWHESPRNSILTAAQALDSGFDGAHLGLAKIDGSNTVTPLYEKELDFYYLSNIYTAVTIVQKTVSMQKGSALVFYVDKKSNGDFDQYNYSVTINNTSYAETEDLKPEVLPINAVFNKDAPVDTVFAVNARGKDFVGIKHGEVMVSADNYVFSGDLLTIKKEYLGQLEKGQKQFIFQTEGGVSEFQMEILEAASQTVPPETPLLPIILGIAGGSAAILGAAAVFIVFSLKARKPAAV